MKLRSSARVQITCLSTAPSDVKTDILALVPLSEMAARKNSKLDIPASKIVQHLVTLSTLVDQLTPAFGAILRGSLHCAYNIKESGCSISKILLVYMSRN